MRRKNKYGFCEFFVLDVCDNKGFLKVKVRVEFFLDVNLENGGYKDYIYWCSNDFLVKKLGKGLFLWDGLRYIEKKINDGSNLDMVVKLNILKFYDVERVLERSNRVDLIFLLWLLFRGDFFCKKVEKCGILVGNNSI